MNSVLLGPALYLNAIPESPPLFFFWKVIPSLVHNSNGGFIWKLNSVIWILLTAWPQSMGEALGLSTKIRILLCEQGVVSFFFNFCFYFLGSSPPMARSNPWTLLILEYLYVNSMVRYNHNKTCNPFSVSCSTKLKSLVAQFLKLCLDSLAHKFDGFIDWKEKEKKLSFLHKQESLLYTPKLF